MIHFSAPKIFSGRRNFYAFLGVFEILGKSGTYFKFAYISGMGSGVLNFFGGWGTIEGVSGQIEISAGARNFCLKIEKKSKNGIFSPYWEVVEISAGWPKFLQKIEISILL